MKSVLVTGGTTRLGKVIADRLRTDGWRVITVSHRADSGADVIADFREGMGAARCFAAALKLLNGEPPTALVNNAALFTGTDEELEAVGLTAPKKLTMMMAGRENGRGTVVNVLDADRFRSGKYGEVKRALREYTSAAAKMFVDTLRVNAVSPGPLLGLSPLAVREKAAFCPLGRPTPEAVADAVSFLIGNDAVTGIDIPVSGGIELAE